MHPRAQHSPALLTVLAAWSMRCWWASLSVSRRCDLRSCSISLKYTVASGKVNMAISGVTLHLFQFRSGATQPCDLCPPVFERHLAWNHASRILLVAGTVEIRPCEKHLSLGARGVSPPQMSSVLHRSRVLCLTCASVERRSSALRQLPFLSSRFLSRAGVSLSMSGFLHLGSPLSSRGTALAVILSSMKSFLFGLAARSAPCVGTLAGRIQSTRSYSS